MDSGIYLTIKERKKKNLHVKEEMLDSLGFN